MAEPGIQVETFVTGPEEWVAYIAGEIPFEVLLEKRYLRTLRTELQNEMKTIDGYVLGLLKDTVNGWSDPPQFVVIDQSSFSNPLESRVAVSFEVAGTGSRKWSWVDEGTRKHPIRSKSGKRMPMRPYVPYTSQGTGLPRSNAGRGIHGGPIGYKDVVQQSTKPRLFTIRIVEHLSSLSHRAIAPRMERAIDRALVKIEQRYRQRTAKLP